MYLQDMMNKQDHLVLMFFHLGKQYKRSWSVSNRNQFGKIHSKVKVLV